MKKICFFFLFLFVSSFLSAQPVRIRVRIHSITGYGQYETFARKAAEALEKVLNSDEFRERMMQMTFIRTNGLTNQQLYDVIMKAHEEEGEGGEDGVVDLRIRTLRVDGDESGWKNRCDTAGRGTKTFGIDGNGDGIAAICPQRLALWAGENNISELAGHYAHEYMHILGFNHYKFLATQNWREKTFVYMIGNLVADLVIKQMNM